MKILITGGAGYIGSHTAVELYNAGYAPVIVDNFCNSHKSVLQGLRSILDDDIVCHEGDCRDESFLDHVFNAEGDIGGAIHFAALKSVSESIEKPDLYRANNLDSLNVLLRCMEKYNVEHLVFSSSACVYGEPDLLPVTEETPLKPPTSVYGETKQACERMIHNAIKEGRPFKAVLLRYFNPIGAHPTALIGELPIGSPNNLVPLITQTAAGWHKGLTIFGDDYDSPDGTAVRDYIHVVDLATAHIAALKYLDNRQHNYETFNLGTGQGHTVLETIRTFEHVNNIKVPYTIGPRRDGDIAALYTACDKAQKELSWTTQYTLADALAHAWAWQQTLAQNKEEVK